MVWITINIKNLNNIKIIRDLLIENTIISLWYELQEWQWIILYPIVGNEILDEKYKIPFFIVKRPCQR